MAHLTTEKYLHKSNMLQFLDAFCLEMFRYYPNDVLNILVVGGSAISLKDGWRDATVDIDTCYTFRGNVQGIIDSVANNYGIYSDWMNSDVMKSTSYSRRLWDNTIFYCKNYNVNIYVVCDLDQLCMKAVALRNKDKEDIDNLILSLRNVGCTFDMFLQRYEYLYVGTVPMKSSAKNYIRRRFKK